MRRFDPARGELGVDLARHDHDGPAARFLDRARPDDRLGVGGPGGRALPPAPFVLLAGDLCALPPIAALVEQGPAMTEGLALIERPDAHAELDLPTPPGVRLRYRHRHGAEPGTTRLLEEAVARAPCRGLAAWVAAEAAATRALRAHLLGERGLCPDALMAASYWKRGFSEPEPLADHPHGHTPGAAAN